uniref:Golgi associated RAB2 interactor protein-like Rab2B-binding domain-containing protein n=1 Tax=Pogona vitticeps TaxID=103695 RepID=A0ABM5GRW0_9SAUR
MIKAMAREKGYFAWKMGPLQTQLRQGEYELFKFSPMFESNFVQISKQGGPTQIHNQEETVTVAITATSPVLLIPDVLLLARPIVSPEEYTPKLKNKFHPHPPVRYELTRLFPLCFVKITIHNAERQQLRFKIANGRTFYLQLSPDSKRQEDLFDAWIRIVQLLRPPLEATLSEKKEQPRKAKGQRKFQGLRRAAKQSKGPSSQHKTALKSIHDPPKKASTHQKEVKKRHKPPPSSESITSPQVTVPPSNVKSVKAQDPLTSPEREETEKKQEDNKTPFSKLEEDEEDMTKAIPGHRSPASEKAEAATKQSNSQPKRKSDPKRKHDNQSRSGQRGTTRKPRKMCALLGACVWGYPKKDERGTKAQERGKKS